MTEDWKARAERAEARVRELEAHECDEGAAMYYRARIAELEGLLRAFMDEKPADHWTNVNAARAALAPAEPDAWGPPASTQALIERPYSRATPAAPRCTCLASDWGPGVTGVQKMKVSLGLGIHAPDCPARSTSAIPAPPDRR
jgi:hypothetical protein